MNEGLTAFKISTGLLFQGLEFVIADLSEKPQKDEAAQRWS